jgi:hypothetical protein
VIGVYISGESEDEKQESRQCESNAEAKEIRAVQTAMRWLLVR